MDLIQFLIQHGADIKAEDNFGKTSLHFAAINGNFLEFTNSKPQNQSFDFDSTIKIIGNIYAAQFLCGHGANITAKCSEGKTPLHYAAQYGICLNSYSIY